MELRLNLNRKQWKEPLNTWGKRLPGQKFCLYQEETVARTENTCSADSCAQNRFRDYCRSWGGVWLLALHCCLFLRRVSASGGLMCFCWEEKGGGSVQPQALHLFFQDKFPLLILNVLKSFGFCSVQNKKHFQNLLSIIFIVSTVLLSDSSNLKSERKRNSASLLGGKSYSSQHVLLPS